MLIYLLNALSMPLYGKKIKNRAVLSVVATTQMFLILALRSVKLGVDMPSYAGAYKYIGRYTFEKLLPKLSLIKSVHLTKKYVLESGYVILNWCSSKLGLDFRTFMIAVAFVTMLGFGYFIYRYSKIPWMSFFLFSTLGMYSYCFGILRQSLAISILLFTVPLLEKKKWLPALPLFFAAFEIHRVSLIFAFLIPFALFDVPLKKKHFKKGFVLIGWFIALSPVIYKAVVVTALRILGKTSYLAVKFQWNKLIVLMLLVLAAVVILCDFSLFKGKFESMMLWAFVLAILVEIIGMSNDVIARAVEVFYIFVIVLIPYVLYTLPEELVISLPGNTALEVNGKALAKWATVALVIMLTLFLAYSVKGAHLYPYKSFNYDRLVAAFGKN